MVRTQIQLPTELFQRAKRYSSDREISLAEMTRRGLELFLDRYPEPFHKPKKWSLPTFKGGTPKVSLDRLKDIVRTDQETRGL
jgi:hypothetical protein